MVYESDFYTTRRPYSRPLVSSYSVTSPVVLPLSTIIQLRGGVPHMPYVAHKRVVPVIHTPVHTFYYSGTVIPVRIHSRVRPSVLAAELNRIRYLWRPSTESYVEKYLNSKDNIYFDDEAREIRARVDSLLRRVHVFIPRASPSDFAEEIIPERMRSDDYIRRLLSGRNNMKKDIDGVSWYEVPERGNFGNLACVKYVAGKPQSIRRPYYKVADLRPSDIKNDVNLLSYYSKNRQAAANASPDDPKTDRELRKARALETEWSEAIAKREAQKARKAQEETTKEEEETQVERKVEVEKAAEVAAATKEAPKEAEAPPKEVEEPPKEVEQPPKETEAPAEEPKAAAEPAKKTKVKRDLKKRAVESVQKEEPAPKPAPEPVQKEEPEQKQEPAPEPEQKQEPAPEPEPEVKQEPVSEPEPEEKQEPVPEPEPEEKQEPAPEPEQKEEPTPEAVQEAEAPSEQPSTEATKETEPPVQAETEEPQELKEEESAKEEIERAEPVSEEKEQNVQDQSDSVRQQKKEAIKRAEEYLAKLEEEAKTDEERRQAAEEDRLRLEIEEQKAWAAVEIALERKAHLDEIIEQERAEETRKAEEKKMEAERIESMEAAERKLNSEKLALLIEQQERMIIEERMEEIQKYQKQENEEKSAEVALNGIGQSKEYDCSHEDQLSGEITDQEREEKPYELVMEDDTRIEEQNVIEEEVEDIPMDPFVEEPRGAEESRAMEGGTAMEDGPKIEEFASGGEENFEWGDEDA